MIRLIPRVENSTAMVLLSPLLALTLTALSAYLIFVFILVDIPVSSVFFTLFVEPLIDSYYFSELLVKSAPLMIIGLGLSIGFRAGIWKPRTRPGGFEGVGEIGLPWLQKVKEETGMLVTTEVGNAQHVELALKYDIDILWIGARTTVNPFAVQEIADALKGVKKPVLVKNPVNPDLALWLGGVERFQAAGISQLGVIHRGFSTYNSLHYRNKPKWHLAIELKKEFPDLPLILDPSHICGRRDTLLDVSQTALDLNYDGLMVETHIDPDKAWSDAAQQITPAQLHQMTLDLKIRQKSSSKESFQSKLNLYRKELDLIDGNIIDILPIEAADRDTVGLRMAGSMDHPKETGA